jgi:hypothetical protein
MIRGKRGTAITIKVFGAFGTSGLQRFWYSFVRLSTRGLTCLGELLSNPLDERTWGLVSRAGSLSIRTPFEEESRLMSWGILHRSSSIIEVLKTLQQGMLRQTYLLEWWIGIPFRIPAGGVEADIVGMGSLILILPGDLPFDFLAFFWGVGVMEALRFFVRVLDASALDMVARFSRTLPLEERAEIGMVGMRRSPTKLGTCEMKLSKVCIQQTRYKLIRK